jgi:hypothetical protein
MIRRRHFLALMVAFAGTAWWAVAEPTAEELERRRQRLETLRKHPEQLARLRDNLKAYLALPEKRQKEITKLDDDLHELTPKKQERLHGVLERYAEWLDQLRDRDPRAYQAIKDAPDAATRLALIKDQRDREWMDLQPKVYRDQWIKLEGPARTEFVAKLRLEDRRKHEQWLIAKRFWRELDGKQPMPCRLSDFASKDNKSNRVKDYVTDYLLPFLTKEEKKKLDDAEGKWPDFPQVLVELASKRPTALPPDPPRKLAELPEPVRHRLIEPKKATDKKKDTIAAKRLEAQIRAYEGPGFASNLVQHYAGKLPTDIEYLASTYNALQPPMRDFVSNQLDPALDQTEKRKLADAAKQWPEYPRTIQELAIKHNLQPPWHILPEPKTWKWDLYRNSRAQSWSSDVAKEKDKKTP